MTMQHRSPQISRKGLCAADNKSTASFTNSSFGEYAQAIRSSKSSGGIHGRRGGVGIRDVRSSRVGLDRRLRVACWRTQSASTGHSASTGQSPPRCCYEAVRRVIGRQSAKGARKPLNSSCVLRRQWQSTWFLDDFRRLAREMRAFSAPFSFKRTQVGRGRDRDWRVRRAKTPARRSWRCRDSGPCDSRTGI